MLTTTTKQIAREDWGFFCDAISRQHEGWLVTTEVQRGSAGTLVEGRCLRFRGIVAEKGAGAVSMVVLLGNVSGEHVTHTIEDVAYLSVQRIETGFDSFETLEIESIDGAKTFVRFQAGDTSEACDETPGS